MNYKKVYLYDLQGNLVKEFKTTDECADYFNHDRMYIYHNLKYCNRIWHKEEKKWYVIKRELDLPIGMQQDY